MRLERSSWPEVESYFESHDLVMLGFGSTENHGRHNPLGTDWMAPTRIMELMEEKRPDILYGPTLHLGSADYFLDYPGTLSLGDDLLFRVARRITGQLFDYGARHFVFVSGHGGNTPALKRCGYELNDMGCQIGLINWWKLAGQINPSWAGGHGGAQETSANLSIDPKSVHMDQVSDKGLINDGGDAFETIGFDDISFERLSPMLIRRARRYATNGWCGPDAPSTASAKWGNEMLTAMAEWMCDFTDAFLEAPLPRPHTRSWK